MPEPDGQSSKSVASATQFLLEESSDLDSSCRQNLGKHVLDWRVAGEHF